MLRKAVTEGIETTKDDKEQLKPVILKEEISYTYNFDADNINFLPGLVHKKGKTKRDFTVFVNIHSDSPLNTSSTYKPGTRTLSWGTPYESALRQAMSALKHSHDQSALLTSWTGRKLRTYVSFIIIPKGAEVEFNIGYAAPQKLIHADLLRESRPGGGTQVRFKSLPKGTIVLTVPLIQNVKIHERATYSLENLFEQTLKAYNIQKIGAEIPLTIVHADLAFIDLEEYVEQTLEKAIP
jgi:hypothetical protein